MDKDDRKEATLVVPVIQRPTLSPNDCLGDGTEGQVTTEATIQSGKLESEVLLPYGQYLAPPLQPPPTALSSSSSSLDSCLAAFPLLPLASRETTLSNFALQQLHQQSMPCSPLLSNCFPLTSTCNCNSTSPLMSALVDMSECSTLAESAVASSDDAMCSSPLFAEIKDRRFTPRKGTNFNEENIQSTPSLSYIRALDHWQEQIFPPVPAIPLQFQGHLAAVTGGWTKCVDVGTNRNYTSGEAAPCGVYGNLSSTSASFRDLHRQSMTNSSRITIDSPSELSLDTCATSVKTQSSMLRSSKRESAGLLKVTSMAGAISMDKRSRPQGVLKESQSPFAFTCDANNDSTSSIVSRNTSRPDTSSRRIAFAPSVRIGTSNPSKEFFLRKDDHYSNSSNSLSEEFRNDAVATGKMPREALPPPLPPKEDPRTGLTRRNMGDLRRPSTAPSLNRKMVEISPFRKLLRPISRGNKEATSVQDSRRHFLRPKTAKAKEEEEDSESMSGESVRSVHAPLHLDGPYESSQSYKFALPLQATRVDDLPEPPRAFYPGTLILVKDQDSRHEDDQVNQQLDPKEALVFEREQQEKGGCPSYMDAVADAAGKDSIVWHGETLHLNREKHKSLKKFKKVVIKVTEVFTTRSGNLDKCDLNGVVVDSEGKDGRERPRSGKEAKRPKSKSRPSTAPSMASIPRWGTSSASKVAKIVSRHEATSQPSILVGAGRERCDIETLRRMEEIRKRNTPWDQHRSDAPQHEDRPCPPLYPNQYRGDNDQSQSEVNCHHSSASVPPQPYRIALVPVARVSPEQLLRMQPVKMVKYPTVDTSM